MKKHKVRKTALPALLQLINDKAEIQTSLHHISEPKLLRTHCCPSGAVGVVGATFWKVLSISLDEILLGT